MERLTGVPSMKSDAVAEGRCSLCDESAAYGSGIDFRCKACEAELCSQCHAKHVCPDNNLMERLVGVPLMKSRRIPTGSCTRCQKSGSLGSFLVYQCLRCAASFCTNCAPAHLSCGDVPTAPPPKIAPLPSHLDRLQGLLGFEAKSQAPYLFPCAQCPKMERKGVPSTNRCRLCKQLLCKNCAAIHTECGFKE